MIDGGINIDSTGFKRYVQILEARLAKLEQLVQKVSAVIAETPNYLLITRSILTVLITRHTWITTELNNPRPPDWGR